MQSHVTPPNAPRNTSELEQPPIGGQRAFAYRTLLLCVLGSTAVWVLEVLEQQGLISRLGESVSRLVVCGFLLLLLGYVARRLSQAVRFAVWICIICVAMELCFEVIEDMDSLRAIPLIGSASPSRHAIEKAIVACWMCSGFYLLYALIQQLDESNAVLRRREAELIVANRQLQTALDELDKTQSKIDQEPRFDSLGQAASRAAHELNNALTPVVAISRTLAQRDLPPAAQDDLALIHSGASNSAEIVKRLLRFLQATGASGSASGLSETSETVANSTAIDSLANKRILCIDDNETIRRALRVLLESSGITVDTAADGKDGLARLRETQYDLLVTDLGMQQMSGREVVAQAKHQYPSLPVAVISGWPREEVLLQFEDGGPQPDFVLQKPVSTRAISACLAAHGLPTGP